MKWGKDTKLLLKRRQINRILSLMGFCIFREFHFVIYGSVPLISCLLEIQYCSPNDGNATLLQISLIGPERLANNNSGYYFSSFFPMLSFKNRMIAPMAFPQSIAIFSISISQRITSAAARFVHQQFLEKFIFICNH
ncbi:hypothetical protein CEXT_160621 [Caerostris extrusa]|uniref:Uncharacterized protein n=1 Tax=Caerostris extrusa TaxID=172846 RepID=A0AAV4YE32_CAEEX|nr:hypothetical protein CEXT_160621 [Caerostris extrusa]